MTHAEMVQRAGRWLRSKMRCNPIFLERRSIMTSESPDALGLTPRGTILIECKVSRTDYLKDQRKPFRARPELGMGGYRYYMTPADLLLPHERPPEGWGLLEVVGSRVVMRHESARFAANAQAEAVLFRSLWLGREREHQIRLGTAETQPA